MTLKPGHGSRYIIASISRADYLRHRSSTSVLEFMYPRGCWGAPVVIDWPLLECVCLATGLRPVVERNRKP